MPTPTLSSGSSQKTTDDERPSFILPLDYIAFSLIVGGLLGWLVFVVSHRK